MVDGDGKWLYASPSYASVLDEADARPGADAFLRAHPDDGERARLAVRRAIATAKPRELSLRLVDREGRIRQYRARLQPLEGKCLIVSQDVTDLRDSEERLLLAAHALEGMTEAILITGAGGTVLTVNRAFCEITGYTRDEVLGLSEKAIRNALQPAEFYDEMYATVQRDGYWSGTTWSRRKNGSVYREWRSVRGVREPAGTITHYVTVFYEVGAPRGVETAEHG
jgi:PAS domain S-box-containing protein